MAGPSKISDDPDAMVVFDRRCVRGNRDRAARSYLAAIQAGRDPEFLHDEVGERLIERLTGVKRTFSNVLLLGCRYGRLARHIAGRPGVHTVVQADFSPRMAALAYKESHLFPTLAMDEEQVPFAAGSFDLVVAPLNLHWVNDLPGALIQIKRILRPDGLFLGAIYGGETLRELREVLLNAESSLEGGATPHISPFADIRDAGALLQRAGFALPVADRDEITATYEHAFSLMYDLRAMGEGNAVNARKRSLSRRGSFMAAAERYLAQHTDQAGRLLATFETIYMTGWAPAEGQQQALQPGSAKRSLAEALGSAEVPLDETLPQKPKGG